MASPSKSSVKIAPGAMVCVECDLRGDITIGSRTVIHPTAKIIAEAGPIIIGENNLIEEQARIINRHPDGTKSHNQTVMIVGNNNVFEVDSHCEAQNIGDNNILEAKASDFAARFSDKDFSKLPSFAKTIQNTPAVCEIMLLIRT